MSKTNCINCGAAKDIDEIKCPFCGTTYLDLTAIDFASGDPVVCQFVLPSGVRLGESKDRVVMSMLAIPQLDEIVQTAKTVDVFGYGGRRLSSFTTGYDVNIGVSFRPVARNDRSEILSLRIVKDDELA